MDFGVMQRIFSSLGKNRCGNNIKRGPQTFSQVKKEDIAIAKRDTINNSARETLTKYIIPNGKTKTYQTAPPQTRGYFCAIT
ncbi:hypothetical protein GCM10008927_02420 [Amylibacter ulvae]|uniref:Uncharacterized protein n=1 Tax=Paramylibacter ulvae TaxID=1651968 RepID=A0ABQ3CT12_9RHOB|nr:hypothetical protein GCM10008927_02420 [Amylibacter ulvae]